jgi:hypothetical protein
LGCRSISNGFNGKRKPPVWIIPYRSIYEVGERDGSCYFSMKLVEGGQLDEVLEREPMPIRQAVTLIAKVAQRFTTRTSTASFIATSNRVTCCSINKRTASDRLWSGATDRD